jgi:predicted tellurium resistance membrane protein TerC
MLGINFSWKMIILIMGGIFLIYKSVMELYYNAYPEKDTLDNQEEQTYKFNILLLQIILIDIIFSIESVIASIGTVTEKWMMYTAIIVSIMIMIASSDFISDFIDQNPSFRTLGLCFLLLIGSVLVVEGIGFTIQSGYVHGAMGFAFLVTVIQMTQIN